MSSEPKNNNKKQPNQVQAHFFLCVSSKLCRPIQMKQASHATKWNTRQELMKHNNKTKNGRKRTKFAFSFSISAFALINLGSQTNLIIFTIQPEIKSHKAKRAKRIEWSVSLGAACSRQLVYAHTLKLRQTNIFRSHFLTLCVCM